MTILTVESIHSMFEKLIPVMNLIISIGNMSNTN